MDVLNERIQSIRIGRNATLKISSYFQDVGDAIRADLSNQELEKLEGILAKVDKDFKFVTPKAKTSKKSVRE